MQGAELTNDRIIARAYLIRIRVCDALEMIAYVPVSCILLETELSWSLLQLSFWRSVDPVFNVFLHKYFQPILNMWMLWYFSVKMDSLYCCFIWCFFNELNLLLDKFTSVHEVLSSLLPPTIIYHPILPTILSHLHNCVLFCNPLTLTRVSMWPLVWSCLFEPGGLSSGYSVKTVDSNLPDSINSQQFSGKV